MRRVLFLGATHLGVLGLGFALGVYTLPILTAPKGPDAAEIAAASADALYTGAFDRDLKGSDFLHWGDGDVMISSTQIVHKGSLSPGPDYRIYLTNTFIETEEQFLPIKNMAREVGTVKSFNGFISKLPADVDPSDYSVIVIWCETFSEFITAARYK